MPTNLCQKNTEIQNKIKNIKTKERIFWWNQKKYDDKHIFEH